ncbi:peptide deformylase [Halanaerobaculum tunisiense]
MSMLNVREVGDPVLRTTAQPVAEVTNKTRNLLDNMAETMYESDGVGLAAPQVGISKSIIVIDIGKGLIELINPEIVEKSEKTYIDEEGCLSIPEQTGQVERAFSVKVEALDRTGEQFEIEGKGLLARALQHEIDHLKGKLFIDKTV